MGRRIGDQRAQNQRRAAHCSGAGGCGKPSRSGINRPRDQGDDLRSGRGNHDDISSTPAMVGSQLSGLGEHQWIDDAHHVGAHPVRLVMVSPEHQDEESAIPGR